MLTWRVGAIGLMLVTALGSAAKTSAGVTGPQLLREPLRSDARVSATPSTRILFTSDWSGRLETYALDPSARSPLGQIRGPQDTPFCGYAVLPCGAIDVVPSPNGRWLVFRSGGVAAFTSTTLSVGHADGSSRVVIARRQYDRAEYSTAAAWSADSARLAYVADDGVHVVRANGTGDRRVLELKGRASDVTWSPSGLSLAVLTGNMVSIITHEKVVRTLEAARTAARLAWSPDGRWIAAFTNWRSPTPVIELLPLMGGRRWQGAGTSGTWSPDGRRLAWLSPSGLHVLRIRDFRSTLLTADAAYDVNRGVFYQRALSLAWAPDGQSIAYLDGAIGADSVETGDLRAVTMTGQKRVLVSAEHAYGGRIVSVAWTRQPSSVRYTPAARASNDRVTPMSVLAFAPVSRLAADGGRVAFTSCLSTYVWTPATGRLEQLDDRVHVHSCFDPPSWDVYGVAVAGDRVAWSERVGCMSMSLTLRVSALGPSSTKPADVASGHGACGSIFNPGLGPVLGSGNTLLYSTWSEMEDRTKPPYRYVATRTELRRVDSSACPCPLVGSSPGAFHLADVDRDRVVAFGENETQLLDRDGGRLLTLPVAPTGARLEDDDLVLLFDGELRLYDARTGVLLRTVTLPNVASSADGCGAGLRSCRDVPVRLWLEDLGHGHVAYLLDGRLHVLRLSDGSDREIGAASQARFMDAGLVYASGSRLTLVRYSELT